VSTPSLSRRCELTVGPFFDLRHIRGTFERRHHALSSNQQGARDVALPSRIDFEPQPFDKPVVKNPVFRL
jgi:hypothetical protein